MKEMTMLDLEKVDLEELAMALDDHSLESEWLFDPESGEILFDTPFDDEVLRTSLESLGISDPDRLIPIRPFDSSVGYRDMEDFISQVSDPQARGLLERAIGGRGAFRRFKDVLFEYPSLREAWFALSNTRARRRAIEWLRDEGLIDPAEADRVVDGMPDPTHPDLGGAFEPWQVARDVADDLREYYGDRLHDVILFGSWARGDAHRESDIDLLVVLDDVHDRTAERDRIDPIVYRHSLDNDTLISVTVCSAGERTEGRRPLFAHVSIDGRPVA